MILVVDDEENTRRSLTDILRLEGYQVNSAATASQAIKLLDEASAQAAPYDLILLDLRMPAEEGQAAEEQSGLNVLHYATEHAPDTQVIFLTAHGSLSTAIEALRSSALDYLLKPASLDQILVSVSKALERRQSILMQRSRQNITSATLASTSNIAASMATAMSSALIQLENSIQALQTIQNPDEGVAPDGSQGLGSEALLAPPGEQRSPGGVEGSAGDGSGSQAGGALRKLQTAEAEKDRPSSNLSEVRFRPEKIFDLGKGLEINFVRREIWQSNLPDVAQNNGDSQESAGEVSAVDEPVSTGKHRRREAGSRNAGKPGGTRILLTPTEGKLMQVFIEHTGRVFTHRELVALVQGYETTDWEAPEVLRPLISRLRRKLSGLPNGRKWIRSIRGTGYMFEIERDE